MLPGKEGEEIEVLLLNDLPRLLTRFIIDVHAFNNWS